MILLCFFILCPHINCIDFFLKCTHSHTNCVQSVYHRLSPSFPQLGCIIFTRTRDIIWIAYYIHIYYPFGVQLACVHCAVELNDLVTILKQSEKKTHTQQQHITVIATATATPMTISYTLEPHIRATVNGQRKAEMGLPKTSYHQLPIYKIKMLPSSFISN